jgi:hypothetical protein
MKSVKVKVALTKTTNGVIAVNGNIEQDKQDNPSSLENDIHTICFQCGFKSNQ